MLHRSFPAVLCQQCLPSSCRPGDAMAAGSPTDRPPSPQWHVYMLRCADGSYYVGTATDVADRVREHNAGHGAAHTRRRLPVRLVWSEPQPNHAAARKRETPEGMAERKDWLVPGCRPGDKSIRPDQRGRTPPGVRLRAPHRLPPSSMVRLRAAAPAAPTTQTSPPTLPTDCVSTCGPRVHRAARAASSTCPALPAAASGRPASSRGPRSGVVAGKAGVDSVVPCNSL